MTYPGQAARTAGGRARLPHLWQVALAAGVLAIVIGTVVLAWPDISVLVASVLFGLYLLLAGCAQTYFAFTLDESSAGRVLLFISGAVSLILSLLAFQHLGGDPFAVVLLAIFIGVAFVVRGLAAAVTAISDRGQPGRGWQIFLAATTAVAGAVVLAIPFTSIVTLAVVVGALLIVMGVFEIVSALAMRRGRNAITFPTHARRPKAA